MIDKQQLRMLAEHQAEQHMCMAKQIEDLQVRLQECANGAAKMQGKRDYACKMMVKFADERDTLHVMLKAVNQRVAVMAELLRGASPFLDYVQSGACHISNDDVSEAIELSDRIAAALAGELPDHIAGAEEMVPVGVGVVDASEVLSLCDSIIHGGAAYQGLIYAKASDLRLAAEAAMLAAAPKPEPTK